MTISAEDLTVVGDVVRRFGERVGATLLSAEGPDGDLAARAGLLDEARELGLLASPGSADAGFETGVWGRHVLESGTALSTVTLGVLAEACAGFAAAVHAQGIGCLALDGTASEHAVVGAAFMPAFGVPLDERTAGDVVQLGEDGTLSGTAHFVASARDPSVLACFARSQGTGTWSAGVVDGETEGVTRTDVGARVGLRAMTQCHTTFVGVPFRVVREGPAADALLRRVLACDWLGQAAIALGTARRAVRDAEAYAAGRYQGGRMIIEHAGVRLLLAHARHDIEVLASVVDARAHVPLATLGTTDLLRWAISARLAAGEHARRAVTGGLQVLGGYGYMDDFGLSKRLRDVSALASMHGGRDQLLLLLQQITPETR